MMTLQKLNPNSKLTCFFCILLIHPLERCIREILSGIGISISFLMLLLYIITFAFGIKILVDFGIRSLDFVKVVFVLLFYGFSYIWVGEAQKEYFLSSDMYVLYLFYVPLAFLVVSRITNWNDLFNDFYVYISDILISLSLLAKFINNNELEYMSYSYNLLPFWGIVLVAATYRKKNFQWIFVIISIIEGLFFGARGTVLWLVVCGVAVVVIQTFDIKHFFANLLRYLFIGVTTIFALVLFLPKIINSSFSQSSYIIRRLQSGTLTESKGRDSLSLACKSLLQHMGLNIYGIFYDRTSLPNGWYSHNIIYEVLISFGWIIGVVAIIYIMYMAFSPIFVKNRYVKIVVVYLLSTLFFRYFVSGSIFDEGVFWVFIGAINSIKHFDKIYRMGDFINDAS